MASTIDTTFPHHRLDAYCVALDFVAAADRVAAPIPRGRRELADQLERASTSTVLLIAEGANRRTAGDKRQRFSMARGECGECAAATEIAMTLRLVPRDDAQRVLVLAARVAAMLTRLIQRFE